MIETWLTHGVERPGRHGKRRALGPPLLVLAAFAGGCAQQPGGAADPEAGRAADAGSVELVRVDNPAGFWTDSGYAEMVPSIRLPTTHDHNDVIGVYLQVPPEGRIRARYLPDQERYTLEFPSGTCADRVEQLRYHAAEGDAALTAVDVRARASAREAASASIACGP